MSKKILLILGGLLVVAVGFYQVNRDDSFLSDSGTATSTANPATSSPISIGTGNLTVDATGGSFTVTPLSTPTEIPIPDLGPLSIVPANQGDFGRTIAPKLALTIEILKKDRANYEAWLNLGILRKQLNDFNGARVVWEYVSEVWPGQSLSFGNLGSLYHLYLRNYQKAEKNFLTAINNEPTGTTWYRSLFELYRDSYKQDTTAAADTLKRGLATIPISFELGTVLADYYADRDDLESAKSYFTKALSIAREQGNSRFVSYIETRLKEISGQ